MDHDRPCFAMPVSLQHPQAEILVSPQSGGENLVEVQLHDSSEFMPIASCRTTYPPELVDLILRQVGPRYLCDEIMRDQDPRYIPNLLKCAILGYIDSSEFDGRRILDFGCGSGASTMILARLFPKVHLVGLELEDRLLEVARARARFENKDNVEFLHAVQPNQLPPNIGTFDHIVLSALYEHLLPPERKSLLPQLWARLRPGGVLFIDQTPHRYFPLEWHTSHLPLINYLPARLALWCARKFSRRVSSAETWPTLLRRGIRGATVREILRILRRTNQTPMLLKARRMGFRDELDLWFQANRPRKPGRMFRGLYLGLKALRLLMRISLPPFLSIAIRKPPLDPDEPGSRTRPERENINELSTQPEAASEGDGVRDAAGGPPRRRGLPEAVFGCALPKAFRALLRCPVCHAPLRDTAEGLQCESPDCGSLYPVHSGVPVLIDERSSVFRIADFLDGRDLYFPASASLRRRLRLLVPSVGRDFGRRRRFVRLLSILRQRPAGGRRVLVLGGAVLGAGLGAIVDQPDLEVLQTDVHLGGRTQVVCDGTALPFEDRAWDGVIAQAVLEHMADPERFVREMHRVTKDDGLVYAETAFLQRVHGGRFDFCRFTHLGHRRLFRWFQELDSGAVHGPAAAMAWAWEGLLMSPFGPGWMQTAAQLLARLSGAGLKYLDLLLSRRPGAYDVAAGYYFMGRPSRKPLSDREIVMSYYRGAVRRK